MSYTDITDKDSILNAIKECNNLGRSAFLEKYGFRKARKYYLVHSGSQYDSKAILGAAHGFQFKKPLTPYDFSGGKNTVVPVLKRLGFEVTAIIIDNANALPEEVSEDTWEGAKKTVKINKFERSASARLACIEHHGSTCTICGFDFAIVFGDDYLGFIHVHHVIPLSKINKRYKVDPKKDLIPVCPNCHAVIHYGGKTRSIKTVKTLFKNSQQT